MEKGNDHQEYHVDDVVITHEDSEGQTKVEIGSQDLYVIGVIGICLSVVVGIVVGMLIRVIPVAAGLLAVAPFAGGGILLGAKKRYRNRTRKN